MANSSRKKNSTPAGEKQPPGPESHTIDIPHEEVSDNNGLSVIPTILTPEEQLKQEIQKFNLADSAIALMKEQYGALTITGVDDKEGYKAVRAAWGEVRSKRTGLEKKGLELRNRYTVITKGISKEEDRLVDLITPLEEDLYKKWKAIDDEKEQEKKRLEQEAEDKLRARVSELMAAGMTLVDGFYQIGGTISMDVATLRGLSDEQYGKLLPAVQAKKAELDQIARDKEEKERKEREEFERQQKDLRDQQQKFKNDQEEFQRKQTKLRQEQEAIEKQKQQIRDQSLIGLGMSLRPDGVWEYDNGFNSVTYSAATLNSLDDVGFAGHLGTISLEIKDKINAWEKHKEELRQEQVRLDQKRTFISDALEAVGLSYKYKGDLFVWSNDFDNITAKMSELIPLDGPEIVNKATEFGRRIMAAEKKHDENIQQQQERLDQERVASQSDSVNWAEYIAILRETPVPDFRSEAFIKRADLFGKKFLNLLEEFSDDTNAQQ
jgi:hypothetical protein